MPGSILWIVAVVVAIIGVVQLLQGQILLADPLVVAALSAPGLQRLPPTRNAR